MLHPLLSLIIFIPIALIIAAFGMLILSLLGVKTSSPLERIVFGFAIGAGLLSLFILAIGLMRLLYAWVIILILAAMAIASAKEFYQFLKASCSKDKLAFSIIDLIPAAVMAMLAFLCIIPALAPSSGMDWDGLSYHLAIPKIYLREHAIVYVPYISHSNFPFLTEMLYTLGLAFKSQSIAKMFHFMMYLGSAIGIYGLCRRYLTKTAGFFAAIIYMAVPVVAWEAGAAYADLSTAFYILLACYAILNWDASKSYNWLIICGICSGFAFSTKVLAAIPIVVLCLVILFMFGRDAKWKVGLKWAFAVGGLAILIGSPWYIKSYVYTGNPFYPFLYEVFGGRYWSQEAADAYRGSQMAFGMGRGIRQFIMMPWNLTVNGTYFFDLPDIKNPKVWGSIGMAFLGLVPISILLAWRNDIIRRLAIISVIFIISWFFMMQYSRYLITIIPMLSIIAGYAVYESGRKLKASKYAVYFFFGLCAIMGVLNGYGFSRESMRAALGLEAPEAFLSRTLDVYPAESWINRNVPEDAKIAVFDEVRGFYLNRDYMWANPGHHEMIPWKRIRNYHDMVRYFIDHGYDYFLVNAKFASPGADHVKMIHDMIANGSARILFSENGVAVLQLKNEKA